LHGSPRVYYSAYPPETLATIARTLDTRTDEVTPTWCIFDNTALGMATTDAITVKSLLSDIARSKHGSYRERDHVIG